MTDFIRKYRIAIIVCTFGLTVLAGFLLPQSQFEFDFSKFLAQDGEEVLYLKKHQEQFGSRNGFLTIAVVNNPTVFDTIFLKKIEAFTEECSNLKNVESATSLPTLKRYVRTPFSWIRKDVLPFENDSLFQQTRLKILADENYVNSYISEDETTLNVLLKVSKKLNLQGKQAYVRGIDSLLTKYNFAETHLAGMVVIEMRYTKLIMEEFGVFLTLCVILIILTLGFIYRSFWGVLLPMLVFLLTVIFLGGILVLTSRNINALSNSLFSIILIVAVSDVIHIFSKFQNDDYSHEKVDLSSVIFNNFLTSITTFIGFFTFYWTPMEVMEKYGVEAAICVILAYVVSMLFVPAVLFCLKPEQIPKVSKKADWLWERFYVLIEKMNGISLTKPPPPPEGGTLRQVNARVKSRFRQGFSFRGRRGFVVLSITTTLLLLALFGITKIQDNPTLVSSMPYGHPVREDIRFLESKNMGSRDFELGIEAKKGKITDLENLKTIEKIQDFLLESDVVCSAVSPVNFYKSAYRARLFDSEKAYRLPDEQKIIKAIDRSVPKGFRKVFNAVLDSTRTRGVILGRMKDRGKNETKKFNDNLLKRISEQIDTSTLSFQPTGTALIVDKINDIQMRATLQGLAIAILIIALIMAVLFRNFRFVIITLVINLIPLILMAGLMGFAGTELRAGTSIVFTIAFVIAVDDTIHFLSSYAWHLRSGATGEEAIRRTIQHTGKALFFTSMVIFLSFGVLLFSVFGDISALGFLVSAAIIFALIADLGVLPWLLRFSDEK